MGRIEIREAGPVDAPAIAEIHLAARREAMPYLHPPHTDDDARAYFARVGRDFGRILLLSGVSPWMGCTMMGSEGPVVQADSTWYSELSVVRAAGIVSIGASRPHMLSGKPGSERGYGDHPARVLPQRTRANASRRRCLALGL